MSTTSKSTTGRRARRATAADTTATDTAATDTPATDTPATDTPATDTTTADTTAADTTPVQEAVGDGAADGAADGGEQEVEESATWEQAVPWLALQVGSRPTALEVAIAVPVWNLLQHAPDTTALRLAADAEARGVALDPGTVGKVLARYERAGIVVSSVDGPVTRWSPITPGAIIAAAKRGMTSTATAGLAGGGRGVRATVAAGTATPAGGLRAEVAEHLAAHPGEDFSPTQLSKALGARSTGAISKACERLVGDRVAVRTSDRPCRYQHGETTDTAAGETTGADTTADTADGATDAATDGGEE